MPFASISKERFEAYFYGRTPFVKVFATELEWLFFEADQTTLLAVMLRCEIDKDFNAVILGRDFDRKFRAIHIVVSKNTREDLIHEIDASIDDLIRRHVNGLFPQGDESAAPFSIFKHIVSEQKRNRYLGLLTDDPMYFPARVMMEELAHWFQDADGIFIRAMQGNEFNARLFELYLHAVFYEFDFWIDRSNPQPDYLLKKGSSIIAVEAVTVAELDDPENKPTALTDETWDNLMAHVDREMPFRFARTLLKKVRHRPEPQKVPYWELPHVKGNPFMIAIHDYSRNMSMAISGAALQSYLYGVQLDKDGITPIDRHYDGDRTIPSNFFGHTGNKNVAAVMLVTGATIPKFNRMGRIAGLRSPNSFAIVSGTRTDQEGNPEEFCALVEHPNYRELWHEGITIFHNPNAELPLDPSIFPHVVHVFFDGTGFEEWVPPNFIISSVTQMMRVDKEAADRVWDELGNTPEPDPAEWMKKLNVQLNK